MNILSIIFGCMTIILIARIVYQFIKKRRLPPSNYTPFDDMMMGIDPDLKQSNELLKDTKHDTAYEEITTRKE